MKIAKQLLIKGLVQGVGFRPSIYRIAIKHSVFGTVENNNSGVIICVEGNNKSISEFIKDISISTPQASKISSIEVTDLPTNGYEDFSIVKSTSKSKDVTEVSPDIGTCIECLNDIKYQTHRLNYAFTNCTNCGPRFSIIKDLPYDRPKTTMDEFPMCKVCAKEYNDIMDRRFHAQPVACNNCGPNYSLEIGGDIIKPIEHILIGTSDLLENGKIIALKGMGGFHIACDGFNEDAIQRVREVKSRDGKPFALMFKDINSASKFLNINSKEKELLTSWRKPIVLLEIKKSISTSIGIGLDRVGVMLPYMPLHHMLFEKLKTPAIVLTSGNISDEPIIINNDLAREKLKPVTDALITYNRDIYNRTDDSVCKVINRIPRVIRRSRSYAPSPVELNLHTEGIFAAGAELVNCFSIGKGKQAILSQHIGDLKNLETLEFYEESVDRYFKLFRFTPQLAAVDLHPDYLSSRFVDKLGIQSTSVQHHHAHIASCMAENNIDEKIIGVSFDGTGLGDDGHVWGGEFFICDLADYERINHFEYIPQPGGDAVSKYPWRMMTSYLIKYFGEDIIKTRPNLFENVDKKELATILNMIKQNINCPLTSSTGRLFDAVAALTGICKISTYHAEAPMQFESISNKHFEAIYSYEISDNISLKHTFVGIIDDMESGVSISNIAGKFHNTIVAIIVDIASEARDKSGINKVILSGGSFQNSILLEKSEIQLLEAGFECYSQSDIPSNDGGIALGQLAIAAKRRELKLICN